MSSASTIQLGPWDLEASFSRGGFGDVWRGTHRRQGVPVAAKVMREARMQQEGARAAFRREVQLAAGLDHPGIVLVLDYGEVDERASAASRGALPVGAPYLVMELASGGDLAAALEETAFDWGDVKGLLLQLLDALAHAHARGIIHRDLKPGNVLDFGEGGWKLADFGIAHPLDQLLEGLREPSRGTPYYMAPEQFLGLFRDYGPWTDLYALGCLTYAMVNGAPPFVERSVEQMARLHIKAPLPPLKPRIRVPGGLRAWLQRIMAKKPSQRFQRAADAARALDGLRVEQPVTGGEWTRPAALAGGVPGTTGEVLLTPRLTAPGVRLGGQLTLGAALPTSELGLLPSLPPGEPADDVTTRPHIVVRAPRARTLSTTDAPTMELGEAQTDEGSVSAIEEPATLPSQALPAELRGVVESAWTPNRNGVPPSWRREEGPARPVALMGAGLELFGLRALPLVGRERERDRIWGELRAVWQDGQPRAVVVSGAAGTGKSRLIEWIAHRAHELGAAIVLKAEHGEPTGATHGLGFMLARHLRCAGLDRVELEKRAGRWLRRHSVTDPLETQALVHVLTDGAAGDQAATLQFQSVQQRHGVIRRTLARVARERTVIVWLDDVQYGAEGIDFAASCLDPRQARDLPVLLLLTAQNEALAQWPERAERLRRLVERERASAQELLPLNEGQGRELIEQLLALDPRLVQQLAARSAGNPMFAIQAVGHWIERGLLEVREGRFALRVGAPAALPDDLHLVWAGHVERLMQGRSGSDATALELAAVLGMDVVRQEWHAACQALGVWPSPDLDAELVARRLARWTEEGFGFVHAMLRESVLRTAQEQGRATRLHAAAGAALDALLASTGKRRLAERAGRHLHAAGSWARAVECLGIGATELRNQGDLLRGLELLDLQQEALDALGAEHRPERVRGWLLAADLQKLRGEHEQAGLLCERAERLAEALGSVALGGAALLERGDLAYKLGRLDEARACTERARRIALELGDVASEANALSQLGRIASRQGELVGAAELYRRAVELFDPDAQAIGLASALAGLGYVTLQLGHDEAAESLFQKAHASYEQRGVVHGMAATLNATGELARVRGDLDTAERCYRQVIQLFDAMGAVDAEVPRINLALVQLSRGQYLDARATLEGVRVSLERAGQLALLAGVYIELLPCLAAERDWKTWDLCIQRGAQLLQASGAADKDDAWPAHLAGDLAAAVGERQRAAEAWTIALRLYEQLGDEVHVEILRRALGEQEAE